jgi:hypothetical protein
MEGVLLNECVTKAFCLSRIVIVQPNELKILVKLELSYILLHCKFQLFVILSYRVMTLRRSKIGE